MLVELLGILRRCREAGGRAYGGGMATAAPTSSGVWERGKERGIWRAARVQPGHGCPCRSMGATGTAAGWPTCGHARHGRVCGVHRDGEQGEGRDGPGLGQLGQLGRHCALGLVHNVPFSFSLTFSFSFCLFYFFSVSFSCCLS